jgi:uncharacterized protein YbjT (DUF2867 family)
MKVLIVGATGSIGRHVVDEAFHQGHSVRALVRSPEKGRQLPAGTKIVVGDLTRPETLGAAVKDVDAIVFAHGSTRASKTASEKSTMAASAISCGHWAITLQGYR